MFVSFNLSSDSQNLSENILNRSFGRLKGYTVTVLNFVRSSLQNQKIAIPASIAFATISCSIAMIANFIFISYLADNKWITGDENTVERFFLCASTLSTTALNLGFYKLLKPAVSPFTYTVLSMGGSIISEGLFYWYFADNN